MFKFDNVLSPGSPTGVALQKSTVVHDDSVSLFVLNLTQVFLIPFLLYLIGGVCLDPCLLITNPPIHSYTFTLP